MLHATGTDEFAACLHDAPGGCVIDLRVVPRARRTELAGGRDGALLVRLAAPPVEDAANEALVAWLADRLGLPLRRVKLVAGLRVRRKRAFVSGLDAGSVAARLRG